jgi:hypothetical protein
LLQRGPRGCAGRRAHDVDAHDVERMANLIEKRERATWTMALSQPGEYLPHNGDPHWWR